MPSISDIIRQNNPYESYIQQLVQLESQQKFQLQDQRAEKNDQKSALGDVSSVISKFISKINELSDASNNALNPIIASSSDDTVVKVDSTSGIDQPVNYNITVDRIASNDTVLSQVKDGSAIDLAAFGDGSIDVTVGSKTETITVDTTNPDASTKTNKEIFESFATKLNDVLGEEIDATVFQIDGNGNIQLSLKSAKTGYDERIQFNNATGTLAEITNNMTHNKPVADLDASFTVDGVTFTRGQNTVDDVISGLTFTLLDGTGNQEQISIEKDPETAEENLDSFISAFNKLNDTIRKQTFVNPETGNRGTLQDMRTIRNLATDLRQSALIDMSSAGAGELKNLTEIGIGFKNDGTMHIEDSDLLKDALAQRPDEVSKLFTDDTSAIAKMKDQAKLYTKSGGVISTLEDGVDRGIDYLDNRIESENRYLEDYEERQRAIFAELQQIMQQGQFQYNQVINFQSKIGL